MWARSGSGWCEGVLSKTFPLASDWQDLIGSTCALCQRATIQQGKKFFAGRMIFSFARVVQLSFTAPVKSILSEKFPATITGGYALRAKPSAAKNYKELQMAAIGC